MMNEETSTPPERRDDDEALRPLDPAELRARQSTLRDLWAFLWERKKLWMAPILTVLLVLALVLALGSTVVAPFIYTLF